MPEFERSEAVAADATHVYDFIADPRNLPKYVATMVMAKPKSSEQLHVAAEVSGRHEEGDARFESDPGRRRIEWSGKAGGYHGWLQVRADGEHRSSVTIHLTTTHAEESDEVEKALTETLTNIKREVAGS